MSTLVHVPIVTPATPTKSPASPAHDTDSLTTPVSGHVQNLIRMFSSEGILNSPQRSQYGHSPSPTSKSSTVIYVDPVSGLDRNTSLIRVAGQPEPTEEPTDREREPSMRSSRSVSDLVNGFESPPRPQQRRTSISRHAHLLSVSPTVTPTDTPTTPPHVAVPCPSSDGTEIACTVKRTESPESEEECQVLEPSVADECVGPTDTTTTNTATTTIITSSADDIIHLVDNLDLDSIRDDVTAAGRDIRISDDDINGRNTAASKDEPLRNTTDDDGDDVIAPEVEVTARDQESGDHARNKMAAVAPKLLELDNNGNVDATGHNGVDGHNGVEGHNGIDGHDDVEGHNGVATRATTMTEDIVDHCGDLTLANTARTLQPWVSEYDTDKDGQYYIRLMNDQRHHVRCMCDVTESLLDIHRDQLCEEVSGKMRATLGKAKLVIKKRFTHFEDLCNNQINQAEDAQFYTNIADLDGFWDVVLLQVDDICDQFADIELLRLNDWKTPEIAKKVITNKTSNVNKSKKKTANKKIAENSAKNAERAKARRHLIEMKRAAAAEIKMAAAAQSDDIEIFVT